MWDPFTYTWLAAATYWLGASGEGLERLEDALERCRSATRAVRRRGTRRHLAAAAPPRSPVWGCSALVHLTQGDVDRASERADAALELSESVGLEEYWVNDGRAHRAGRPPDSRRTRRRRSSRARPRTRGRPPRRAARSRLIHALVARGLAAEADGDRTAARAFVGEARSTLLSCPDPGPGRVVAASGRRRSRLLGRPTRRRHPRRPLVEEFSERELDVLRLLGSELSQREIGNALFISFNTVKSHSKSIYRKLGVGTRSDAVDRARELDLL